MSSKRVVLRGGAFNNESRNAGCAYRNRNNPNNRNDNIGFRVVASTLFTCRKCGAALAELRRRGTKKNGGAHSRPRARSSPRGHRRRANSNGPWPWMPILAKGQSNLMGTAVYKPLCSFENLLSA